MHKFVIGQKARFVPEMSQVGNWREIFVVVRQLPEAGGMFQYRIESETDRHNRVVREDQLDDL